MAAAHSHLAVSVLAAGPAWEAVPSRGMGLLLREGARAEATSSRLKRRAPAAGARAVSKCSTGSGQRPKTRPGVAFHLVAAGGRTRQGTRGEGRDEDEDDRIREECARARARARARFGKGAKTSRVRSRLARERQTGASRARVKSGATQVDPTLSCRLFQEGARYAYPSCSE